MSQYSSPIKELMGVGNCRLKMRMMRMIPNQFLDTTNLNMKNYFYNDIK